MPYPAEVQAVVLGMLAPNSGFLTRRHFEAVETQTEVPAETARGWAARAGMLEIRRTGVRGRPPGPALTAYQRQGADAVPKVIGRPEPTEHLGFTSQETARLNGFLQAVDGPGWRAKIWWL